MQITPDLLRELEELCQACGSDSWMATIHMADGEVFVEHDHCEYGVAHVSSFHEASFIAAAHNAMPSLLQYIRELEGKVAEQVEACRRCNWEYGFEVEDNTGG